MVSSLSERANLVPTEFSQAFRARLSHAESDFWVSQNRAKVITSFNDLAALRFILTHQERFKTATKVGRDALKASGVPESGATYQKLLNALRAARAAYWIATTVEVAEVTLVELSSCRHKVPQASSEIQRGTARVPRRNGSGFAEGEIFTG